jgi:outer membrane protein OmpA-like peptidoglycan-associated protein
MKPSAAIADYFYRVSQMSKSQWLKTCVNGLVLWSACTLCLAQSAATETLLTGNQVTKDALINALKVDPLADQAVDSDAARDASDTPGRKTRGLKLALAPANVAKPHKASLLITFAVDSAKLTRESHGMLDLMADAMQSEALAGATFSIEGHADPRGDETHNLYLSQQRAESVMAYLVERRGIAKERLQAKGKGSSELLNVQKQDAPENRRVTFVNVKP